MSANLCCFYCLTRPRKKVDSIAIENKSEVIQPEIIKQPQSEYNSPQGNHRNNNNNNHNNQNPPQPQTIEVINIQPKISQTIVTYHQSSQISEIETSPRVPRKREIYLIPIKETGSIVPFFMILFKFPSDSLVVGICSHKKWLLWDQI